MEETIVTEITRRLAELAMEFAKLVERTVEEPRLRQAIDELVAAKRAGGEMDEGPRVPAIGDFIQLEIARFETIAANLPKQETATEPVNQLFRATLDEVWRG